MAFKGREEASPLHSSLLELVGQPDRFAVGAVRPGELTEVVGWQRVERRST